MRCPIILTVVLAAGSAAAAESIEINTSLAFDAGADRLALASQPASSEAPDPAAPVEVQPIFGEPGHWWGQIGAGYAREWDNHQAADDFSLAFTFSTFLIQDFEFMLEVGGWYFNQPGDDALGLSLSFGLRWHLLNFDTWTLFVDGGIGILGSTDRVPDDGSGFNFIPRAGVGGTIKLGDGPGRLVVGVRWHHISNARIFGEDRNPSRDGPMGYAAFQFPF